jgi:hypothetical protein
MGKRGEWLKRGEDVRRWPENTCRGRVHDKGRGLEVGDGLTGGLGGTEREAGARAKGTAPTALAHWAAGGREGEKGREG